jgi:hypothetical protein
MDLYVYNRDGDYMGIFLKFDNENQWTVWYINRHHTIKYETDYTSVDIVDSEERDRRVKEKGIKL